MLLEVVRDTFTNISTIGRLLIDGKFECYTLEDVVRAGKKVQNQTAIPYGTYQVITNRSARFSAKAGHDVYLPLLLNVPGFDGIRIHPGNTDVDTDGCILLGHIKTANFIGESVAAFNAFFPMLEAALKKAPVHITIRYA